jgi:CheY-like chemotaxis protein/outer membrane murein-binding lipoprotein Lpp
MPTALIVEDEPEANKLLAMLVQLRGYQTESAFDGAQALEKLRKFVPDVVFLDLMLPDRDGYDVCRAVRASVPTSKVPVIIVTARITADNRIESFSAGADDYVPKPYTPDQIFQALDQSHAWREELADSSVEGQVVLDGRDDGQTLRRLAHLRRLLLLRGGIEAQAIDRISSAIRALWSSVDQWARRSRREQVATLSYALDDEALSLTVHDEAGWLASLPDLTDERAWPMVAAAQFDGISTDRAAARLKLVKRLKSPGPAGGTSA